MKPGRQNVILEIIEQQNIETQNQLLETTIDGARAVLVQYYGDKLDMIEVSECGMQICEKADPNVELIFDDFERFFAIFNAHCRRFNGGIRRKPIKIRLTDATSQAQTHALSGKFGPFTALQACHTGGIALTPKIQFPSG